MDPSYNGLEILNDFVLRCYLLLTVIEGFLQNWIQTKYLLLISHCELSSKQKQIDSLASDLSAEHGCECSDEKDGEDSHEECADGGEKEAPPLPGLQTQLLVPHHRVPHRPRVHHGVPHRLGAHAQAGPHTILISRGGVASERL